jgi:mannosyltransferase OCH1-like enzyme
MAVSEHTIEKVLHQIWIGPHPKPDLYMNTFAGDYIAKYPEYRYEFWNEGRIDALEMPQRVRDIYTSEPTLFGKADIARLVILYNHGGIYIDADVVWVNEKCLDDLLERSRDTGLFAAYQPGTTFIANSVIGACRHNEQIAFLLNAVLPKRYRERSTRSPWEVTGPLLFNVLQKKKRPITIFPSAYFYPIEWHGIRDPQLHKKIELPKESYMFQYGISTNNLKYYD